MKQLPALLLLFVLNLVQAQPSSWTASGIGGGGSLFSPTISPSNASVMYMQCDMSEVFHTANAGATWDHVHFKQLISTGGQHKVEFTSDPNILYSVNLSFNEDARYPVKSVNGGVTWLPLANDPTDNEVWHISADPTSTSRVIVTSYNELFLSTDGGATFQLKYTDPSELYIAGIFWDGTNIFIGTNKGMVISTNNGSTFAPDGGSGIPAGQGFISFTGARNSGVVRLMGTLAAQGDLYPGVNALDIDIYAGLIKRDFGVNNWTSATTGITAGHLLFNIASSRINTIVFYVAGNNPSTSYPVVYKTSNGGTSWSEVFLTNNNQNINTGYSGYQGDEDWWFGEIVFGLAVGPNDPNTVIITDFGFAHITQNGGTTWKQAYVDVTDQNPMNSPTPKDKAYKNNGLENTSCWNLHWKKDNANNIFASYTDITGVRSLNGGTSWAFDYNGITYNTVYQVIEHPTSNILYAAVSSVHDMYQSTYLTDAKIDGGIGAILYSTDNGANWSILHNFAKPVIWLAIDPTNSNRMYASVINSTIGGIYRTDNLNSGAASTWIKTTSPGRTEGHPYNVYVLNDGAVVSTWSGRRTSVFTKSSGVFISNNLGTSWTDVSLDDEMHYWTKDITIDPNDQTQNTWYVSVHSGWGGAANDKGGLYKTINRGMTWIKAFDSYRVESATVDPVNPNKVYATTESEGLWYSSNATSPNPIFTQLVEYDFMHPLRVVFNPFDLSKIFVTSFGNGIKNGTALSIPLSVKLLSFEGKAQNEYNYLQWIAENDQNISSYEVQRMNSSGDFKTIITVNALHSGTDKSVYEAKDHDFSNQNYYRLQIVDKNGEKSYSEVVYIARKEELYYVSEPYPQPISERVNIDVKSPHDSEMDIEIFDAPGRLIHSSSEKIHEGMNNIKINTSTWLPGMYIIVLKNGKEARVIRKAIK